MFRLSLTLWGCEGEAPLFTPANRVNVGTLSVAPLKRARETVRVLKTNMGRSIDDTVQNPELGTHQ